jgi:hypothetical protein
MDGPIPEVKNLDPTKLGSPFSKQWPYPIELDSVKAAPNNHKLLYGDDHVRLVEVTERPRSQENLHGHPYLSVFVNDSVSAAPSKEQGNSDPQSNAALGRPGPYHKGENGDYGLDQKAIPMERGKLGQPPAGMVAPNCSAATPQSPHAHINGSEVPLHFYRLEYLHIDGNSYRSEWRNEDQIGRE